jgi:NAD+ kinase
MRVYVVANSDKQIVRAVLDDLLAWLKQHADVVGLETELDRPLHHIQADVVVVMGGDGTLLSVSRRLSGNHIPLMGINFGKLGFLSSFTPNDFKHHFQALKDGKLAIRPRMTLEASVLRDDDTCDAMDGDTVQSQRRFMATGLNDAVITAGPPFRMIEMEISVNNEPGIRFRGDGVIISTPSGSTAYNISAGGPILNSEVEAFCITPVCPHSLSFRPVVVDGRSTISIVAHHVNDGTTLFCDGQINTQLRAGERIIIRRGPHDVMLIENPDARGWRVLAEKLHWGMTPNYNHQ